MIIDFKHNVSEVGGRNIDITLVIKSLTIVYYRSGRIPGVSAERMFLSLRGAKVAN
jgi:hypothetical protein